MQNFLSKMMDMLVGETEQDPDRGISPREIRPPKSREDNIIPMQARHNKHELLIYNPTSFDDVQQILDGLLENKAIIVNFADMPHVDRQRFLDFLGGALYAIKGNSKKIADAIFVFASRNVSIKDVLEQKY